MCSFFSDNIDVMLLLQRCLYRYSVIWWFNSVWFFPATWCSGGWINNDIDIYAAHFILKVNV